MNNILESVTLLLPVKARPYAKGIIGLVGFVLTVLALVVSDNETLNAIIAAATALGVVGVPNVDSDEDGTPDWADPDTYAPAEPEAPADEPEVEILD